MRGMTTFLSNRDIYTSVACSLVPQARERLWIATADIKDMYVDSGGRDMVPFLEVLDGMVKRGVEVRLVHAKAPGPNWRDDFDRQTTIRLEDRADSQKKHLIGLKGAIRPRRRRQARRGHRPDRHSDGLRRHL